MKNFSLIPKPSHHPPYCHTEKGRSLSNVLGTALFACIATVLILTHNPILMLIGVFFVVVVLGGIYEFLKGERWSVSVEDGVFSWSYPRWPKSSGRINLSMVCNIVVNNCSGTLSFTFQDGSTRKIKFLGYRREFRDYLIAHFPHVSVEYVDAL